MDLKQYKAALEAILFAYAEPVETEHLAEILCVDENVVEGLLNTICDELNKNDRGLILLKLENKWQFSTKSEYGDYIKKALDKSRNAPLSQAAMEVLAIIAYNQPVTRSFIEQVRNIDSSHIVHKLLQKGLIAEAGRLDLPGKPISFCTTDVFLRSFGISSLAQLPSLHDDEQEVENDSAENADDDAIFPEMAEFGDVREISSILESIDLENN